VSLDAVTKAVREELTLLTLAEAAALLRVSTRTLRNARDKGQLPMVRIGRRCLVHPRDLAAFIEGGRT
jgi:excisionase family DNA binding protein